MSTNETNPITDMAANADPNFIFCGSKGCTVSGIGATSSCVAQAARQILASMGSVPAVAQDAAIGGLITTAASAAALGGISPLALGIGALAGTLNSVCKGSNSKR